jgi:hypothetical protein
LTLNLAHARWRVSGRSDGSSTCVEAATDGNTVALGNSTARHPHGPALTVPADRWLDFITHVQAGHLNTPLPQTPAAAGPFHVDITDRNLIRVRLADQPDGPQLLYTPDEWHVFVSGVTEDGEFTLTWLTDTALI